MEFPKHIQNAVDLGLLKAEEGRIIGVGQEEVESVFGIARLVEKIQPTTQSEGDDTTEQEAIVLCRVLTSAPGTARELWAELRIAVGIGHGQDLPRQLWSNPEFRAVGTLIDRIFNGEADGGNLISKQHLIQTFSLNNVKFCSKIDFERTVCHLSEHDTLERYGDGNSEFGIALDLLRQARARANFVTAQHQADKLIKSDTKLEQAIESQQNELMRCLGMLRGSVGNEGNATDAVQDLLAPKEGSQSFIDMIIEARKQSQPISTGITAMDIDMEGGVRRPGESAGGRLFALAARTGVGKTVLGVYSAVKLAYGGLTVGFISAEMDKAAISARIWSSATYINAKGSYQYIDKDQKRRKCVTVGDIESPPSSKERREEISAIIANAAMAIQDNGGKLLVEDPWGADVESVVNSLRSMKAKNPDLRCAVIDHFHVLARHKGAPSSEAAMLEERAYRLMNCAKQLQIDLIVLAQMNRVGMDSVGREQDPTLDQIRGTDALAHVSHAVWIVRKEIKDVNGQKKWKGGLEFWHAKTRGRQAHWVDDHMEGIKEFIAKSSLQMDYAYCAVESDLTDDEINMIIKS